MAVVEKKFVFVDKASGEFLTVKIQEVAGAGYGFYIWPCAPVLAHYIWLNRTGVQGKTIIEIGAGTSLPGIVAAKCGAKVILSDRSSVKSCLHICHQNAELNGLAGVPVFPVTWGHVTAALANLPQLDIILASDCFYDSKDFEDVVMTLSYLLHKNARAQVWCSYQERSSERTIKHLLDCWHLQGEEVDSPDMEMVESSFLGHNHVIQLFIIRAKG